MNCPSIIGLSLVLSLLVAPSTAFAFVQTMTCTEGGVYACEPGEQARPVHWPSDCITYFVNEQGSADIGSGDDGLISPDLIDAIVASFDEWNAPAGSGLSVVYGGLSNEDRAEYVADRGAEKNANVVMWRDEDWPYASKTAFAITSVTFDPKTGLIADADLELNGVHHDFSLDDDMRKVDVQNTITHEAGHFVGLDHTPIREATMYGSAPNGEIQKRTLHQDDIDGLVHIYPAAGQQTCHPVGDGYFEKPDDEVRQGCCTTVSGSGRTSPAGWIAGLLVGAALLRRRRQRARQGREVVE